MKHLVGNQPSEVTINKNGIVNFEKLCFMNQPSVAANF